MCEGGWDVDKEVPLFLSTSYFMLLQEANFPTPQGSLNFHLIHFILMGGIYCIGIIKIG